MFQRHPLRFLAPAFEHGLS
jgi:hypothetical protein